LLRVPIEIMYIISEIERSIFSCIYHHHSDCTLYDSYLAAIFDFLKWSDERFINWQMKTTTQIEMLFCTSHSSTFNPRLIPSHHEASFIIAIVSTKRCFRVCTTCLIPFFDINTLNLWCYGGARGKPHFLCGHTNSLVTVITQYLSGMERN
jgi:hypothetical protein